MVRAGRKPAAVSEWEPDFHKACCSLWVVAATNPEVPMGVLFDIVRGRGSFAGTAHWDQYFVLQE